MFFNKDKRSSIHLRRIIIIAFLSVFLLSCGVKKGVRYFEDIDKNQTIVNVQSSKLRYQPNDIVTIRVSSPDNVGVAPFNLTTGSYKTDSNSATTSQGSNLPYQINEDGTVNFPLLGKIEMVGKTEEEVVVNIEARLKPYINQPSVDIDLQNFSISLLGDVKSPGRYMVDNERINILEALALAGDLTISGLRDEVIVLREKNDKTEFIRVNLLDESLFNSEAYYLQQNDIVYVEPNAIKTRDASWDSKILSYTGIAGFLLSVYTILSR